MQNPGLLKNSLIAGSRSPTAGFGRATLAQKPHAAPYCPSAKGNIMIPGRAGVSPKVAGQAFHKFRSPSYTEQNTAALKLKFPTKGKNTVKILPKN